MLSQRQLYLLDVVAGLGFALPGVMILFNWSVGFSDTGSNPVVSAILVLVGSLPLAVRRRWPRPVFGIVFLAAVVNGLLGVLGFGLFAAAFALYTVAVTTLRPRWEPTVAIGIVTGGLALFTTTAGATPGVDLSGLLLGAISLGAAWTIGRAMQARREYRNQLLRRYAEQAVAEDRLRIARDLHDVIAHSLGMITVKSGVAAHIASDQPEHAADALSTIEVTSREALAEVRRILGVLRSSDAAGGETMPRLSDLPDLLADHDGPSVRLTLGGPNGHQDMDSDAAAPQITKQILDGIPDITALPFDVQLTAYRIVQEGLTNTRRHSWAGSCEVRVVQVDDQLEIEVVDDGTGVAGEPSVGNGLRGMTERVGMYGGSLQAGNREGGGFRVRAMIPLTNVRQSS